MIVAADKMVRVNAKIASAVAGAGAADLRHHRQGRPSSTSAARASAPSSTRTSRSNVPLGRNYGDVIAARPGRLRRPQRQRLDRRLDRPREHLHRQRRQRHRHRIRQPRERDAVDRRRHQPAPRVPAADRRQQRRLPGRATAARWAASSTACSSRAATSSTAACSRTGRPTGWPSNPTPITTVGRSLGYVRKPDYDTSIGAEVGGPIIKDRLFFWAGFAPRFENTHVFRQTYVQLYDPIDRWAPQPTRPATRSRSRTPTGARASTSRARPTTTPPRVDLIPRPEHHLTLAAMGTPELQRADAVVQRRRVHLEPVVGAGEADQEQLDFTAHWTSKLYDHRWQIDARAGIHTRVSSTTARPNAALNDRNQLEYWGANLWDLERAPGLRADRANGVSSPAPSTTTTRAASA